ncbi:hypothetical protein PENPOL_c016G07901 [Penicillium polonicum]|uniref:Uncharacterized protein n=1 Tax=Penicillium polonicum TaxID=60169 RepID=A0A1V6N9R8_PENPO|nr:hypothetical protein PENPOL_c016G07901 [Penicillium polonicum]
MGSQLDFLLFGNCSIEAPTKEEVDRISQYLPLLKAFDTSLKTRVKEVWDLAIAFEELVEQDTMVWKSLGVDRTPHFVQPSGSIKSPLAIHLFNPTFFVADLQSTVTDDPTNPTISLLHDCGLSSDYCFMFDEICRRERTDDCLLFYTEDLRRPHRHFIQKVRENMSATVEICFGEEVFKEIRKTTRLIFRLNAKNSELRSIIASFHKVVEDMGPFYEESDDYVDSEIFDFGDIPTTLQLWLHSQNGLKVHGVPITNRETLELAFSLLDKGRISNLNQFSTEYLARMIGIMYIQKLTRAQKSGFKQIKAIPGEPGKIIRLKCGGCQRPVLDDAFPFFVAELPDCYLIEVVRSDQKGGNGCGQNGCKGKPGLVPANHMVQDHTRMETRAIAQTKRRKANWKAPLCRTGKDLEGCAETIRVRCRGHGQSNQKIECGRERDYDTPEWTIHSPARLVQPRLKCDCDGRGKDHYFEPVDKNIDMVSLTSLRRIYQGFLDAHCDLTDYPKLPGIIFDLEPNGDPKKKPRTYRERFEYLKNAKIALTGSN